MKVSVVTIHYARNFGSMLQTYATEQKIRKLGFDVEIVNYIPQGLRLITNINTIKKKGNLLVDFARKIVAAVVFSYAQLGMICFNRKFLTLSKRVYHCYDELQENPPVADYYIAGSDQIWNTQNKNRENDIDGYYLAFAPHSGHKISYASSIGKDSFSEKEKKEVFDKLVDYKAISVRESYAKSLLQSIGVQNVTQVLDPTLLLTASEWAAFVKNNKRRKMANRGRPYILVYNLNRNQSLKSCAKKLSEIVGLRIINLSGCLDFLPGALNVPINSPIDFLFYLKDASYVLTDSFHGTAFSINFNKQFMTFSAPKYNSRLYSLLELFKLSDRLFDVKQDISMIKQKIDYTSVNTILNEERERSIEFLKSALD